MPWDRSARATAMLDALDAGREVHADAGRRWESVYGPDLVDVALDLLLDGVTGAVGVLPGERMTELAFAQALALVADADESRVVATGSPATAPLFAWDNAVSYLPPCESMIERFVRESRAARRTGDLAVARRRDDTREQAPKGELPLRADLIDPADFEAPLAPLQEAAE